jgi:cob(I)alamin adenosyltransferase
MTGRNPAGELIDLSDYVSKVKKIKHPFDKGVAARQGIEF